MSKNKNKSKEKEDISEFGQTSSFASLEGEIQSPDKIQTQPKILKKKYIDEEEKKEPSGVPKIVI